MEPQILLARRLPHVAQLTLPWTGVLGGATSQAPAVPDLPLGLLVDESSDPLVHVAVPGGAHQHVRLQDLTALQLDGAWAELGHLRAGLDLDAPVGDQLRGAYVDVVAGAAAEVLAEEARVVLSRVKQEASLTKPLQQGPVFLLLHLDCLPVHIWQHLERDAAELEVRIIRADASGSRVLAVEWGQQRAHQGVRSDDVRGGPLEHRHVGASMVKLLGYVVGRVVASDDHSLLALKAVSSGELG
mmetsp:Transcript_53240/g.155040  ORF Transcript_53240/g.155040 Transcript_53240/m.155040 type:complete len:243 (+) Transcript_53240:332-1060(+)